MKKVILLVFLGILAGGCATSGATRQNLSVGEEIQLRRQVENERDGFHDRHMDHLDWRLDKESQDNHHEINQSREGRSWYREITRNNDRLRDDIVRWSNSSRSSSGWGSGSSMGGWDSSSGSPRATSSKKPRWRPRVIRDNSGSSSSRPYRPNSSPSNGWGDGPSMGGWE